MPFHVLNRLAKQELDPASDKAYFDSHAPSFKAFLKRFEFTHLFHSPSQRCVSLTSYIRTLPHSSIPKIEIRTELQEIKFDLAELFETPHVALPEIKLRIIERLLQGGAGVESLSDVLDRVRGFIKTLPSSGNVLILSHGYLMMVIAALLQSSREEISKEALVSIPRFGYFDGFSVEEATIDYFSIGNQLGASTDT